MQPYIQAMLHLDLINRLGSTFKAVAQHYQGVWYITRNSLSHQQWMIIQEYIYSKQSVISILGRAKHLGSSPVTMPNISMCAVHFNVIDRCFHLLVLSNSTIDFFYFITNNVEILSWIMNHWVSICIVVLTITLVTAFLGSTLRPKQPISYSK